MFHPDNSLELDSFLNRVVLNEQDPSLKREHSLFTLKDSQVLDHLNGHLMVKTGDTLKVLVINEGLGKGKVINISPEEVTLDVTIDSPGLKPNVHLIVGASRPPTLKKVLEHGTSFGVSSFSFFKAELSEKSYLTSKVFEEHSLNDLLTKGLAQGSTFCHLPEVKRFNSLEKVLSEIPSQSQRFLLSLTGEKTFHQENLSQKSPIVLAIGPERGWTKKEEEFLMSNSFRPILIGESILRVEIATFSALGQLAMLSLNR